MLVVATAFAVPVVVAPFTASNTEVAKLTLLWALGLLSLACWLGWWATRRARPPLPRTAVFAGVLVAVVALASLWSQQPVLSLRGTYSRYFGLLPLSVDVMWMLLVVAWFRDQPERLASVLWALALAATVSSVVVLLQFAGHDWLDWGLTRTATVTAHQDHRHNPTGTMGYDNFAGGLVGIVLPCLAFLLVRVRRVGLRALVVVALGVNLGALWATHSRGGMLAGLVGLLAFGAASGLRYARVAQVAGALALVGLVLVGGLVAWKRDAISWKPEFRRDVAPVADTQLLAPGSFVARTFAWQAAARILARHPVIGTGPGTFYANFPPNRPRQSGAYDGLALVDDPHQIFLTYATSAGVLGLGAFVAVVTSVLRRAVKRLASLDPPSRLLLAGALGCAVAYLGQGLVSIDQPALALLGWLALGATAAFSERPTPEGTRPTARTSVRTVVAAGGAIACLALVVAGARPLLADRMVKRAYRMAEDPATEAKGDTAFATAIRLDPLESVYSLMAGDSAERRAVASAPEEAPRLFRLAAAHYGKALRARPNNVIYLVSAARSYGEWGRLDPAQLETADRLWARAEARDSHDYQVHFLWAQMLTAQADATGRTEPRRRAVVQLRHAVALRGDLADIWLALADNYLADGDHDGAERSARNALRFAPGDARAREILAGAGAGAQ